MTFVQLGCKVKDAIAMGKISAIMDELVDFVGDNPTRAEVIIDHFQVIMLEGIRLEHEEN